MADPLYLASAFPGWQPDPTVDDPRLAAAFAPRWLAAASSPAADPASTGAAVSGAVRPPVAPTGPSSGPSGALGEVDIRKAISQAFDLGKDINDRYNNPQTRKPQPLGAIDTDLAAYDVLARQMAAITASDRLPPAPAGAPDYAAQAARAALHLYGAAVNAGLAEAAHIPPAVIDGAVKPPLKAPFFKR
jgi:hypothetical protein